MLHPVEAHVGNWISPTEIRFPVTAGNAKTNERQTSQQPESDFNRLP